MSVARLIKLTVSLLYREVQRLRRRRALVVLYYHAVTDEQAGRFRAQMEWLRARARVMPLSQIASTAGDRWAVAVTFDDAFESVRRNALPVLESLRIPATVFAVSGNLGRTPAWRMEASCPDANEPIMTADALRTLPTDLIAIGSHTASHPSMSQLPADEARREAAESKSALASILDRPVDDFSFPYGEYDDVALAAVDEAGYERIFTSDPNTVRPAARVIGRFATSPDDWPVEFRLKAVGAYGWLRQVQRLKRAFARAPRRTEQPVSVVTQS